MSGKRAFMPSFLIIIYSRQTDLLDIIDG
jgi:hypothetical protein